MDVRIEVVSRQANGGGRPRHGPEDLRPAHVPQAAFTWPVRVYYEDTDLGGVVYHANYLRFLERARTEWLRHLGFEQTELHMRLGVQFVVVSVRLDYHRAARFNDSLDVSVVVTGIGRASLMFKQDIRDVRDGQRLCSGEVRVACVDTENFKPKPLPRELVAELA